MKECINKEELMSIVESNNQNPHNVLGINEVEDGNYCITVYHPYAKKIKILDLDKNEEIFLHELDNTRIFTNRIKEKINYKVLYTDYNGNSWESYDPYNFEPTLGELDTYLFGQGTHYQVYEKLGAHVKTIEGIRGVSFAVWAPNAKRVSVLGDFNGWDGRILPMRNLNGSGIFEIFVPELKDNEKYKYEIKSQSGEVIVKADPYANYSELRPNTASIVFDSKFEWSDSKFELQKEKLDNLDQPMSIYELHLGSWMKNDTENGFLTYKELAHKVADYVQDMGYTHIELMPVSEHPFDGSWGYQVTGYFAPTSRFGNPDDFKYFVDYLHNKGIGIILDWVPAHFPKDAHGLRKFDGTALYEHADPRQGEHPHWGTLIFNYGRNEVKNFLISNAIYWIEEYHIDGLRVDAVASMLYLDYGKEDGGWVPNKFGGRENLEAVEFFKHLNSILFNRNKNLLMIAEESTAWSGVTAPVDTGGLGFNLKWNMGWMNDFLRYIEKEPIHRRFHHNDLTFGMVYAYTENFILVLSHDEVVHGKGSMIEKMPGDYWQKFANLRAAYGFMFGHPGKKLTFMGSDFGQFDEWSEENSIQWNLLEFDKHKELKTYMKDLLHMYKKEPALWDCDFDQAGFEWINCTDWEESIVSFIRKSKTTDDVIVIVSNFTPVPRTMHRIGVNKPGKYIELINSDDMKYGGSDVRNKGEVETKDIPWDGKEYSLDLKIPPLGTIILKLEKK